MNYDLNTKQGMANSVEWTRAYLNRIADGGIWFVPRSACAYKVLHSEKTLIAMGPGPAEDCICRVVEAMGWTVKKGH